MLKDAGALLFSMCLLAANAACGGGEPSHCKTIGVGYIEEPGGMLRTETAVDFALATVGSSSTQTLVIRNDGRVALSIEPQPAEGFSKAFTFLLSSLELREGAEETLTIGFAPREVGDVSGTLTLALTNSAPDELTIHLRGVGVAPDETAP